MRKQLTVGFVQPHLATLPLDTESNLTSEESDPKGVAKVPVNPESERQTVTSWNINETIKNVTKRYKKPIVEITTQKILCFWTQLTTAIGIHGAQEWTPARRRLFGLLEGFDGSVVRQPKNTAKGSHCCEVSAFNGAPFSLVIQNRKVQVDQNRLWLENFLWRL